jgi:hypothetical protein
LNAAFASSLANPLSKLEAALWASGESEFVCGGAVKAFITVTKRMASEYFCPLISYSLELNPHAKTKSKLQGRQIVEISRPFYWGRGGDPGGLGSVGVELPAPLICDPGEVSEMPVPGMSDAARAFPSCSNCCL